MRPASNLEFPKTAAEFYQRRDDRTDRCVKERTYQSVACAVSIDSALASSATGQAMLFTACNLLSRWCRIVEIVLPEACVKVIVAIHGDQLGNALLGMMHDANPFGNFSITQSPTRDKTLRLHVGNEVPNDSDFAVRINATGWVASIGTHLPVPQIDDENVIGAIAAACLGVAQVFKRALGMDRGLLFADGLLDMYTLARTAANGSYNPGPRIKKFCPGKVLMVGAGSVGSSVAYCLRLARAVLDLTIIDLDRVLVENMNRSPLFGKANFDLNKAEAVAGWLHGSSVSPTAFPGSWNDFVRERRRDGFDVWLPLANEDGVRESMQSNVPPMSVFGTTSPNWAACHGRSIPGVDDCLLDRFPSGDVEKALVCSTSEVELPGGRVDAALPFLSLFAGLMVVAEFARLQLSGYQTIPNYACVDFGGPLHEIQKLDFAPRADCSCRKLSPGIYKLFNRQGKYFGLSFAAEKKGR